MEVRRRIWILMNSSYVINSLILHRLWHLGSLMGMYLNRHPISLRRHQIILPGTGLWSDYRPPDWDANRGVVISIVESKG